MISILLATGVQGCGEESEHLAPMDLIYSEPTVFEAVGAASEIARVRLLKREPIYAGSGSSVICDYRYEGEVVEWLKPASGDRRIVWYSNVDSDYWGMKPDYLIFVSNDPMFANAEPTSCVSGKVQLPTSYLGMYAFDERAERQLGGEWLSPPRSPGRPPIGWCWNGEVSELPLPGTEHIFLDRDYQVDRWTMVRREIEFAITHPKSRLTSC
jgi:hypothetical protein